ncbi:hypothetical protein M0P65_00015 [Candidatus Gracilibacteria bacterium]|nr:hypothetical protein [Candidatus Gracilibacteria bacterium]
MDKKAKIISVVTAVVLFTTIGYVLGHNKDTNSGNLNNPNIEKKDKIVENEKDKILKDVHKIDYNTTLTGIVLDKFSPNKNIALSGGNLIVDGKTLTGEFLNVFNETISKDKDKYLFTKKISNIDFSKALSGTNPEKSSSGNTIKKEKIYELKFVKGFSKMKLLGEYYDFNDKNINLGNGYDLQLFITGDSAYVVNFENAEENKGRRKQFNDYTQKIEEIRSKYGDDPYTANKLINELNKSYDIKIRQLQ